MPVAEPEPGQNTRSRMLHSAFSAFLRALRHSCSAIVAEAHPNGWGHDNPPQNIPEVQVVASGPGSGMRKTWTIGAVALLAGILMMPNYQAVARGGGGGFHGGGGGFHGGFGGGGFRGGGFGGFRGGGFGRFGGFRGGFGRFGGGRFGRGFGFYGGYGGYGCYYPYYYGCYY
jgi:hypothetical protein